MYIIGTGIEHLRAQETKQMIYGCFAEDTVKILRPDIQNLGADCGTMSRR